MIPAPITCFTLTASETLAPTLPSFPGRIWNQVVWSWFSSRSFLRHPTGQPGLLEGETSAVQCGTWHSRNPLWGNNFSLQRCTRTAACSRGNERRTAICAVGEQPGLARTPVARHAFRKTLGAEA